MPIHINLLAEAQAAEDMRRRDPVKRAIWIACLCVAAMLVWASYLQLNAMIKNKELTDVLARLQSRNKEYQQVLQDRKKAEEVNLKLTKLTQLATNRFLYGNLLDSLQHAVIDDVQLLKLKVDQSYAYADGIPPKTNDNRVVLGRPATVTEKIVLTLDARITGAKPEDQVARFKQAIYSQPYFQAALGKTNEILSENWSAPQTDAEGHTFTTVTLRCSFPEHTR